MAEVELNKRDIRYGTLYQCGCWKLQGIISKILNGKRDQHTFFAHSDANSAGFAFLMRSLGTTKSRSPLSRLKVLSKAEKMIFGATPEIFARCLEICDLYRSIKLSSGLA